MRDTRSSLGDSRPDDQAATGSPPQAPGRVPDQFAADDPSCSRSELHDVAADNFSAISLAEHVARQRAATEALTEVAAAHDAVANSIIHYVELLARHRPDVDLTVVGRVVGHIARAAVQAATERPPP